MKRIVFAAFALGLATSGIAGCSQEAEAPPEAEPEGTPGVSIENARIVLPAVTGNPGALYFDVSYEGEPGRSAVIKGVHVDGASMAMFHSSREMAGTMQMESVSQVAVEPGQSVSFEPGALHVMVMELSDTLSAGGTAEVTLTFANGDKFSFPAEIRAPGDAD